MPRRPADPDERQRSRTFLANHREVIAAVDSFTVPTLTVRVLYAFLLIRHARRMMIHVRVTAHPTAAWITQQLREAFPCDQAPRCLILDHVIALNEWHLRRLLACFASYDLDDRTHSSVKKDAPAMRAVDTKPDPAAEIVALPCLGGLHHRYGWRPAA